MWPRLPMSCMVVSIPCACEVQAPHWSVQIAAALTMTYDIIRLRGCIHAPALTLCHLGTAMLVWPVVASRSAVEGYYNLQMTRDR